MVHSKTALLKPFDHERSDLRVIFHDQNPHNETLPDCPDDGESKVAILRAPRF
jgi:hypothetical protein